MLAAAILVPSAEARAQTPTFEPLHRATVAVRASLTTTPAVETFEAARGPFETELAAVEDKVKGARDKRVYEKYARLKAVFETLGTEWRKAADDTKPGADNTLLNQMSPKFVAVIKQIDDANGTAITAARSSRSPSRSRYRSGGQ